MVTTVIREDFRDAMLDAAERLLSLHGFRNLTLDAIIAEAGVDPGLIDGHSLTKEEVVLEHVDRIVERLRDRLWRIERSGAAAAVRLRQMLVTRVLFRFDSILQYSQSLNELLADLRPQLLARRERYFDAEALILSEVLIQGRDALEFDVQDPLATGYALLDATNSLLPYGLSVAELGERLEVEVRAKAVADILVQGVLHRPAPPA